MPGVRPKNLRIGDRSELLVEQLLAGFAFTTRVPRQEDHGIDFFCNLISEEGQLLKAGSFFTVQAKSSAEPIVYEKDYELEWIRNQENPLLLCVADRKALAMDVYSTWNLLCAVLNGWRGQRLSNRIRLLPNAKAHMWPGVIDNDDGSQDVFLGDPIVRITDEDIFDERLDSIADVVREWVNLDRTNVVNRHAGIYWVLGPLSYRTGDRGWVSGPTGVSFYVNPHNLDRCCANLGRIATALTFIMRNPQSGLDLGKTPWQQRLQTLEAMLKTHWDTFDGAVQQFLTNKGLVPRNTT